MSDTLPVNNICGNYKLREQKHAEQNCEKSEGAIYSQCSLVSTNVTRINSQHLDSICADMCRGLTNQLVLVSQNRIL